MLVGKFSFKHQVNWNTVCGAMQDPPWRNIWSADNPVKVLNEHLLLLVPVKRTDVLAPPS